jgi:hypothetical protein
MHSHTASILGITRDQAKIVNYGSSRALSVCEYIFLYLAHFVWT